MALLNELDAEATAAALTEWLSGRLPDATDVAIRELEIPQSAGMSMTTILLTAAWTQDGQTKERRLVARVAPITPGVFKRPDISKEFRLLEILSDTPVPVPAPHWLEDDPSVLGAPFLVVDRVDGRVPADDPPYTVEGWFMDLPSERRRIPFDGALEQVAAIQELDWEQLGLGQLLDESEFGAPGIDQQIGHWMDSYEWARDGGAGSSTIDAAFDWMRKNQPSEHQLVLNWGDARVGNVIFGEDLSVRAVLDWEMACIGSPDADIGWMAFMTRYMTEGVGAPLPEGMPDRGELIGRYEQLTGRTAAHVDYYEAFSALQLSVIYLRVGRLMISAGKLPSDSAIAVNNPCSQILAKLTGLPAPAGTTDNYVGNR